MSVLHLHHLPSTLPYSHTLPPSLSLISGHPQILSRSCGEKSGEGLGSLLCHGLEMVDMVNTYNVDSVCTNRVHHFWFMT